MEKIICSIKSIKFLKILWIVIILLLCYIWAFISAKIGSFVVFSIALISKVEIESNLILKVVMPIFIIGLILMIILSIVIWKRIKNRCMECKKIGALVFLKEENIGTKDINIPMDVEQKNKDGEIIYTTKQYISGTRTKYKKVYKCKFCGKEKIITYTKDTPNL